MTSQILCIGVSDSSAGTGIQADIKTAQAFGSYAATAVAAVSVQNTQGVFGMQPIPADILRNQINVVMEDLEPKVIKSGMLGNIENLDVVSDFYDDMFERDDVQIVVDPVMTSRTGKILLNKDFMDELKRRLLIRAHVLTPNVKEAETLTGMQIKDVDDMCHAAEMLMTLGAKTVILKGGSLAGETVYDVLVDDNGAEIYQNPRVESQATHGAGTTFSTGLAVGLAQGLSIRDASARSREYVSKAIQAGQGIGKGYGPLNHLPFDGFCH